MSQINPTSGVQSPGLLLPATFDNATKLLRVKGQENLGAVTYGAGAIGLREPRTAHSYLPEFEAELNNGSGGQSARLTVQEFAQKLSDFFLRQWNVAGMPATGIDDMVFLVGGYDPDGIYGRVFEMYIPSRPKPVEQLSGQFGAVWGGQREITDRILRGYDFRVPTIVADHLGGFTPQKVNEMEANLAKTLGAKIPWPFLPLQDCVDLAIFLIRTTISIQQWTVDVRGVGGAIDVATITRTGGFQSIQQKQVSGERIAVDNRL